MVSTRYYSAKTRSQKQKKTYSVSMKEKNVKCYNTSKKHDIKPQKTVHKKIIDATKTNFNHSSKRSLKHLQDNCHFDPEEKHIAKKSNNVAKKAVPQKMKRKKSVKLKQFSVVTKPGKLCKISKRVNSSAHKKKQNYSGTIKAKNTKNKDIPVKLKVKKNSLDQKKKELQNTKSQIKNNKKTSVKISDLKPQKKGNNKKSHSDGILNESKIDLSPVTFKKSIRKFLLHEILRRRQENSIGRRVSRKSQNCNGCMTVLRTNKKCNSSSSSPKLPSTQHNMSPQLISTQDECRHHDAIKPIVNNNNVPNLVLSTNPNLPRSTKNHSHSDFQKNEHNLYCNRIVTRNITKKNKFLKLNFKDISKPNMSSLMKVMNKPPLKQNSSITKVNTSQNNRVQRSVSMPCLDQAIHNSKFKAKSITEKNSPNMKLKNKNETLHSKKNKEKQKKFKEQKELDAEILNIVDDLKEVDENVNSKILSLKLKDSNVQYVPPQVQMTNTLIIHRKKSPKPLKKTSLNNAQVAATKNSMRIENKSFVNKSKTFSKNLNTVHKINSQTKKLVTPSPVTTDPAILIRGNQINDEKVLDKSNETPTATRKSRTTLPLTLKTKIVVTNGKKVKKKLSLQEQRIYNLLRCYGDKNLIKESPVKDQKNSKSSKDQKNSIGETCNEKVRPKSPSNLKESPVQSQKKSTTSKDKKVSLSESYPQKVEQKSTANLNESSVKAQKKTTASNDKNVSLSETCYEKGKQKSPSNLKESPLKAQKKTSPPEGKDYSLDKSCYEKDNQKSPSNLSKVSTTPSKLSLSMKETAATSDKEKRKLHKEKYNIIKNIKDSEQNYELLPEEPKKSLNDKKISKQKIDDKRKEYVLSSNSSGIESADYDNNSGENEISMDESNEKQIKSSRNEIMLGGKCSDWNESDDSMSSVFKKYKTNPKSKKSSFTPTGSHKRKSQDKIKTGRRKSPSGNIQGKYSTKPSHTLENLSVEKEQCITSNLLNNGNKSIPLDSSNKIIINNNNLVGDVHSDVDIFDDSRTMCTLIKNPINKNNINDDITTPLSSGINKTQGNKQHDRKQVKSDSHKKNVINENFKEIANEHQKKYKTKDLVENLMQWTAHDPNLTSFDHSLVRSRDRDALNYRDYTTRTGIAQNPVRILKRKVCEDLKKQLGNEYKNGKNGKDYFQCICFNKFFITKVRNKVTHNFDILTVKVKPNKNENVFSMNDVQFCKFCSRIYDKYRNNFILINQEYIMKEFIEQHTKSWNRINKSYDNEFSMNTSNMSNFCNLSFASTTSTPCDSQTNSRTESRLDSISSEKTESLNMGSEYSDFYLNDIFLQNTKIPSDLAKHASPHNFQNYKQKCHNIKLKINEICDLYKSSSQRISSTETRSNATDDCSLDDGVFARPNSMLSMKEPSRCDYSIISATCRKEGSGEHIQHTRDACYLDRNQRAHTTFNSRRCSTQSDNLDEDSDGHSRTNKNLKTSSWSTRSQSPCSNYSPRRDYMQKHKLEKTKESFERIFRKVWKKCSPSTKRYFDSKNNSCSNSPRKKKAKLSDEYNHKRHFKESSMRYKNNQSMMSDFTDEYDADLSDSDGNCATDIDCYSCSTPKRSSQFSKYKKKNQVLLNRSLGNDVIYKERHHQYVNNYFIKQSSKHLFTNNKTSYSDSEQVIKIRNVKKQIYTTIHQKVYNTQDDLTNSRSGLKPVNRCNGSEKQCVNKKRQNNYSSCFPQNMKNAYKMERRNCFEKHDGNTSASKSHTDINKATVNKQSKITPLKDKIQQIEYENLWKKLVEEDQVDSNNAGINQSTKESVQSDSIIETDIDKDDEISLLRSEEEKEEDSGIRSSTTDTHSPMDMSRDILPTTQMNSTCVNPDTTKQCNENVILTINNNTYRPKKANKKCKANLNEILVSKVDHSTRKLKNYEHIKEDIKNYAATVSQSSEPFNKQYVLRLLKNLMKSKSITFNDYENALKKLKINVNLNNNNDFFIKHVTKYSDQDDVIMKNCFSKLYEKYHQNNPDHSMSTFLNETPTDVRETNESFSTSTRDQIETFESFKAHLTNQNLAMQEEEIKMKPHFVDKFCKDNSTQMNNIEFFFDRGCDDEFDISIPIDENRLFQINKLCTAPTSTLDDCKIKECDKKVGVNSEPNQSSDEWRDMFVIKQEVDRPGSCDDQLVYQENNEMVKPSPAEENLP